MKVYRVVDDIVAKEHVDRLVHITPERARLRFAAEQRRRLELAQGEIAAATAALAWATGDWT